MKVSEWVIEYIRLAICWLNVSHTDTTAAYKRERERASFCIRSLDPLSTECCLPLCLCVCCVSHLQAAMIMLMKLLIDLLDAVDDDCKKISSMDYYAFSVSILVYMLLFYWQIFCSGFSLSTHLPLLHSIHRLYYIYMLLLRCRCETGDQQTTYEECLFRCLRMPIV